MTAPPLVSIGMPVYNGAVYLEEALESLLGQSHPRLEILISDNASDDGTQEICERFAASNACIKYVRQPTNRGPFANFNFVASLARGEYFMWAAHDDLWDSQWVERLLNRLAPGVFVAIGRLVQIDSAGQTIRDYGDLSFEGPSWLRLTRYFFAEEWAGKANLIYGLCRTRAVREIEFKARTVGGYGADMHFVFDCLRHGTAVCDPSVALYKRYATPRRGHRLTRALRSVLLVERIPYYLAYARIVEARVGRMALLALAPLAYAKAVVLNMGLLPARRRVHERFLESMRQDAEPRRGWNA